VKSLRLSDVSGMCVPRLTFQFRQCDGRGMSVHLPYALIAADMGSQRDRLRRRKRCIPCGAIFDGLDGFAVGVLAKVSETAAAALTVGYIRHRSGDNTTTRKEMACRAAEECRIDYSNTSVSLAFTRRSTEERGRVVRTFSNHVCAPHHSSDQPLVLFSFSLF
jgi:hypothetical protein